MFYESNESMSHESSHESTDRISGFLQKDLISVFQSKKADKSAKRKVSEILVHLLRHAYFMPKGFSDV